MGLRHFYCGRGVKGDSAGQCSSHVAVHTVQLYLNLYYAMLA